MKKKTIKNGIFLSEFFFFKYNKHFIINMFIYYLDLEKTAYIFINHIYTKYYSLIREKKKEFSISILICS